MLKRLQARSFALIQTQAKWSALPSFLSHGLLLLINIFTHNTNRCVLRDSGALDVAGRLYYTSLEDDEGWHQLLTVNIDNGTSITTKVDRVSVSVRGCVSVVCVQGLQPLVVVRLAGSSAPTLCGFDDNKIWSVNTKNGATSQVMAGLDGGPSQSGFAFSEADGVCVFALCIV